MRVHVVDPAAYTPPYDHALCAALARAGADVELVTSRFAHGDGAAARAGYAVDERFYRAPRAPRPRARRAQLAQHVPDMLRYRRAARGADVVHFQWLAVQPLDAAPAAARTRAARADRPRRAAARAAGRASARRSARLYERVDAVVVHSEHGARAAASTSSASTRRARPRDPARASCAPRRRRRAAAAPSCADVDGPVVLLLRPAAPLQGHRRAARGLARASSDAELWIVGLPRMDTAPLRAAAPPGVRFVERFVADAELAGALPPRRPRRAALPRDRPVRRAVHRAGASARRCVLSDVGGFPEVAAAGAAELVPPGDAAALRAALARLLADAARRASAWRGRAAPRRRALRLGRDRRARTSSSTTRCWREPRVRRRCFWVRASALLVYTQVGYPLLLAAARPRAPRRAATGARRPRRRRAVASRWSSPPTARPT